jgi:hypothetical protein
MVVKQLLVLRFHPCVEISNEDGLLYSLPDLFIALRVHGLNLFFNFYCTLTFKVDPQVFLLLMFVFHLS